MFKGAVSGAAEWVGGAIGGAIGGPKGAVIGKELGGALGSKISSYGGGGGEFQPMSTQVQVPSFGVGLPTMRPGMGKYVPGPKVVDAATLNKIWEDRLTTYMATAAKFDRTTEVSKLIRSLKA
tara:strand:+ start:350 stop:718 length:369 start_codon:yes stop_codon:yes gene_type:complete